MNDGIDAFDSKTCILHNERTLNVLDWNIIDAREEKLRKILSINGQKSGFSLQLFFVMS